jgi:hypothetical protein
LISIRAEVETKADIRPVGGDILYHRVGALPIEEYQLFMHLISRSEMSSIIFPT